MLVVENDILMARAREALAGRWGMAVAVSAIFWVLTWSLQLVPVIGSIGSFVITGPLSLGVVHFGLSVSRREASSVSQVFSGFQDFGRSLGAYFFSVLFILLWGLLLIVPGIMAALSYSMVFFVLADHPELGAREAIAESKKMMLGHRWRLSCLGGRFIGWVLLSLLTLGIGFLWLGPYMSVSMAMFYEDLKARQSALD